MFVPCPLIICRFGSGSDGRSCTLPTSYAVCGWSVSELGMSTVADVVFVFGEVFSLYFFVFLLSSLVDGSRFCAPEKTVSPRVLRSVRLRLRACRLQSLFQFRFCFRQLPQCWMCDMLPQTFLTVDCSQDSAISSTLFSCLWSTSILQFTVFPSSPSSTSTESSNCEHSFSTPRRACKDLRFVIRD